ncbi:MAG: hypothetical protein J6X28_04785 [Bacilli bacterium]|nr:hypothetical protein [Bacilli bacterium]
MKQKKKYIFFLLLFLIVIISVGYAVIQSGLSINGTSQIHDVSWDVHFDNIQVSTGSVAIGTGDQAATITPTNLTEITYTVTLNKPGDYYEFTVDVVNGGTIDAMISSVSSQINGENISTLPNYLVYSATYADSTPIQNNHLLAASSSETYLIRIGYNRDITEEDLLSITPTFNLSFGVNFMQKNESAISKNTALYSEVKPNAVLDTVSSPYVSSSTGINFLSMPGDTNGKGVYIKSGTENDLYPIYYYRGGVTNNFVIFANHCWRIVRTTNNGGVKLVYNGSPSNGTCSDTGSTTAFSSAYNTHHFVTQDIGFMYGSKSYTTGEGTNVSDYVSGGGYTWDGTNYTLTDVSTGIDNNHHYTCANSTGVCTKIRFYYFYQRRVYYYNYIELQNGQSELDVLAETFENEQNSLIKSQLETWYAENLIDYASQIDDAVWCNDRTIGNLNGWNAHGGALRDSLEFSSYVRNRNGEPSLACIKRDSFTVQETASGNGKLTYPIGLLTLDELVLAGGTFSNSANSNYYLNIGSSICDLTPRTAGNNGYMGMMHYNGSLNYSVQADETGCGFRPAIVLAPGIGITGGDGTAEHPYIVE